MVLAPLNIAGVTVAAVAAGDMALAGDALADREARDARAKLGDLADILMADDLWGLDVLLRPLVPFVDMDVGAADRGLVDLDENFSGPGTGTGTCRSSNPGPAVGFTMASIICFICNPPFLQKLICPYSVDCTIKYVHPIKTYYRTNPVLSRGWCFKTKTFRRTET